jgi:hypothetical protein
MNKQGLQFLN